MSLTSVIGIFLIHLSFALALDNKECSRSVDVGIVGAGPAGTYFAYRLRTAGLNVEVFEYNHRIGGRLFTTTLPSVPDLKLELGGMRYTVKDHVIVHRLVKELNLTEVTFHKRTKRYFLRGHSLTVDDINNGSVPYKISDEERANMADISNYYLQKLTGYRGKFGIEQALNLTLKDGRKLYKFTMDEVLDMVATEEGKRLFTDITGFDGDVNEDITAVEYFLFESTDSHLVTLKEGLSALPTSLLQAFLRSSARHKFTNGRKLEAISDRKNGQYELLFRQVQIKDGLNVETETTELVCAKKVVLALPKPSLLLLSWNILSHRNYTEALSALNTVKANKVFLTFPTSWWLNSSRYPAFIVTSDLPFRQMYDWNCSVISSRCAMIASYADLFSTVYLEKLNSKGAPANGSINLSNVVTENLLNKIISNLADAFGIDRNQIPEPVNAISQFYTKAPIGCGWATWKAGYNFTDVTNTLLRPSLTDDVFVVGSDYAFVGSNPWIEGGLWTVDQVFDKYFTRGVQ